MDIEPTFQIKMLEDLSAPEGALQFQVSTLEEKECLNYELNFSLTQTTSGFSISLDELQEPEDCITGSTFVSEIVPLEPLQIKAYTAEINLKNTIKNEGTLVVTSGYYQLQLETFNGLLIQSKKLNKVPNSAIWGRITYNSTDLAPIAQQFIDELENLTYQRNMPDGNYGYFNIDSQGLIWFSGTSNGGGLGRDVIYHYDSPNVQPIINLVSNYRDQYGPNLDIDLTNGRGIEF